MSEPESRNTKYTIDVRQRISNDQKIYFNLLMGGAYFHDKRRRTELPDKITVSIPIKTVIDIALIVEKLVPNDYYRKIDLVSCVTIENTYFSRDPNCTDPAKIEYVESDKSLLIFNKIIINKTGSVMLKIQPKSRIWLVANLTELFDFK